MNIKIRKLLIGNFIYILLLIILSLFLIYSYYFKNEKHIDTKNKTNFIGIINNYTLDGNKLNLIVNGEEKLKVTYYINKEKEKNALQKNLQYGKKVKLMCELSKPINNTIPNTFNYKNYLKSKNINHLCKASKIELLENKISFFYNLKNIIRKRIENFASSDYILMFLIGDKSLMDQEALNAYQINGVTHLFAISGMHVGMFSMILIYVLKRIKIKESIRYLIISVFLLIYCFLTNFSPSINRATIFFVLVAVNKIFYTHISVLKIFIITISILLFINPYNIYDLGFIYSAVTSFGLVIGSEYINSKNYFTTLLKVSYIAFLFSLPITLVNFYEINLLTIFNNLIFVPLVSFIIYPISLITFVFSFFEPIFIVFINIIETISFELVKFNINLVIPKINVIYILIYYLSVVLYLKKNQKYLILAIMVLLIPKLLVYFNNNYEIYFLDVGQGDALLIRSPNNKENIMIDVGGRVNYKEESWAIKQRKFNMSSNIILFLKSLGINKLDTIIGTHGDDDHLGETINMINNFKIKSIVLNQGSYNDLEKKIIKTNIKVKDKYYSNNYQINYLKTKLAKNENDNSQIILLNINGYKILLMGDASKTQELEIIKKYDLDNIILLKLGHHGSKTSSDENFLKFVKPRYSIISSGRNNRFNHPHHITISNLNKYNLKYYNTQDKGTIKITINDSMKFSFTSP